MLYDYFRSSKGSIFYSFDDFLMNIPILSLLSSKWDGVYFVPMCFIVYCMLTFINFVVLGSCYSSRVLFSMLIYVMLQWQYSSWIHRSEKMLGDRIKFYVTTFAPMATKVAICAAIATTLKVALDMVRESRKSESEPVKVVVEDVDLSSRTYLASKFSDGTVFVAEQVEKPISAYQGGDEELPVPREHVYPVYHKQTTTTLIQMEPKLLRNQRILSFVHTRSNGEIKPAALALGICDDIIVVNAHVWRSRVESKFVFSMTNPANHIVTTRQEIDESDVTLLGGDLVAMRVVGERFPSLFEFLPDNLDEAIQAFEQASCLRFGGVSVQTGEIKRASVTNVKVTEMICPETRQALGLGGRYVLDKPYCVGGACGSVTFGSSEGRVRLLTFHSIGWDFSGGRSGAGYFLHKGLFESYQSLNDGVEVIMPSLHQLGVDVVMGDPHPMSIGREILNEKPSVECFGHDNIQTKRKESTEIVPTTLGMVLSQFGGEDFVCEHKPADMRGREDYLRTLRVIFGAKPEVMNAGVLMRAVTDLTNHLSKAIVEGGVTSRKLTLAEAINGCPEMGIVPTNPKKSIGWPLFGPKMKGLVGTAGNYSLSPAAQRDYDRLLALLKRGCVETPVFNATLKDEAVKITKVKTRVFYAGPFVFGLLCRQYISPIFSALRKLGFKCETAVGINALGEAWHHLASYLHVGEDGVLYIAGDFADYDASIPPELAKAAHLVILALARLLGFSDEDCLIVKCLLIGLLKSIVRVRGVHLFVNGSSMSGWCSTTDFNNILLELILRYVFFIRAPELDGLTFADFVNLVCYGDDHIAALLRACGWFNQLAIAEEVAKFGMTYTSADKESELTEYSTRDSLAFLKRNFTWSEEFKRYVGQLGRGSIKKALYFRKLKSGCSEIEHCADVVDNFQREYVLYGRAIYEEMYKKMLACFNRPIRTSSGVAIPLRFKTYDQRLREKSVEYDVDPEECDVDCEEDEYWSGSCSYNMLRLCSYSEIATLPSKGEL
jgi:hypothetical protein